jgi:DNA-binding LacI/PurR family transcriptional regulator
MNIEIPEKCSIACCNGFESENALCIPSLTETGIPGRFWGEALVKLLKQRFDGEETESLGIKLPAELTIRESSGPAPDISKKS